MVIGTTKMCLVEQWDATTRTHHLVKQSFRSIRMSAANTTLVSFDALRLHVLWPTQPLNLAQMSFFARHRSADEQRRFDADLDVREDTANRDPTFFDAFMADREPCGYRPAYLPPYTPADIAAIKNVSFRLCPGTRARYVTMGSARAHLTCLCYKRVLSGLRLSVRD